MACRKGRRFIRKLVIVVVAAAFCVEPWRGTAEAQAPIVEGTRARVQALYESASAVEIVLEDGAGLRGRIIRADADAFIVKEEKTARELALQYREVLEIRKTGLTGQYKKGDSGRNYRRGVGCAVLRSLSAGFSVSGGSVLVPCFYFLPSDALISATDVSRSGFSVCTDMIRSTSSFSRSSCPRTPSCPRPEDRNRAGRRRQVEHVGVDQDLFLRQIPDHEAIGMRKPLDHVDLERARGILEHPLVAREAFDHRLLARLRQRIGRQRPRRGQRRLRNALLTSGVTIVMPSATTAGRPLV